MRADDADRKAAREQFLPAVRSVYSLAQTDRHAIPYTDGHVKGFLPAYPFTPAQSKGTIVFFGGFDSYIEELMQAFFYLRDAGYEVIAFQGPGQGGALNEAGLPMTAEWHKPVKAVLNYFQVDRVTSSGFQWWEVSYSAPRLSGRALSALLPMVFLPTSWMSIFVR